MQIGAVFPQTEIEMDAAAAREWAQAVEAMGLSHVVAYDHVLGAATEHRPGWKGPYTVDSTFHEPFVLFSYLAGVTSRVGFFTGVIILPQRQTALVAKQAASLDVLAGGRLRLGAGSGWNEVEYEALGVPFAGRGARYDEQIDVLRALLSERVVTFRGAHHTITEAGINPLPLQRPLPIWMGGGNDSPLTGQPASEAVLRRIARAADGWFVLWQPDDRGRELLARFHGYVREAGRDPAAVGIEGRIDARLASAERWAELARAWSDLGASHLCLNTMGDGLRGATAHIKRLEMVVGALRG